MKLVVDTSVAFNLFKRDSFLMKFICENEFELFAPEQLFEELNEHSAKVCRLSGISQNEFEKVEVLLREMIDTEVVNKESLERCESLIPHKEDAPFLALALKLDIPIWSDDRHFKRQKRVKVFTTEELKPFLGK